MKKIIILLIPFLLLGCSNKVIEEKQEYILNNNLTFEVYDSFKLSSLFEEINVELVDDYTIYLDELGNKKYNFKYKNNGIIKEGIIDINVVDTTKPIVRLGSTYTVEVGYNKKLQDVILSGDNYDKNPKREIVGSYNLNKTGEYNIEYHVLDNSGNLTIHPFTLRVIPKSTGYEETYTSFNDIKEKHKDNKVGVDVSFWQGNIDFNKLKASGVDFVMIRVGTQKNFNKDSELDSKFIRNIKAANEAGIKAGIYYYSYASSKKEAIEQALWVYDKIKDYKIDLPIAFDWESFSSFNKLGLSLHDFNEISYAFLDTLKEKGYNVYLYGSANYLTDVFVPKHDVWLAHYTDKTDYKGEYNMWQICNNGRVDGIYGYVDIDILYE